MDAKQRVAARNYQDFDPPSELVVEDECDTLLIYLPGFRKEHLEVQRNKTGNLIISGEQPVGNNNWRRFQKTIPVSKNCDISKITAKFERFILHIVQPKLIIAAEKQDEEKPTSAEAPEPQKPEESSQKATSLTNPAEQTNETSNKSEENSGRVPDKAQEKEKEQETGDGKSKESNDFRNVQEKAPETEDTNAKSKESNDSRNVQEKAPETEDTNAKSKESNDSRNVQEKAPETEDTNVKSKESNDSKNVQEKTPESNDSKNVQEKAPETEDTSAKSVSENTLTSDTTNGTAEDGKIKESTNQKQESELSNFAENMDGGATRLKMPRKVMNLVLAIILAVALVLYVKKIT